MTVFTPLAGEGPLYQRLYGAIRHAIKSGRLQPGTRLPATRTLAAELGVSRKVVLMAFERLLAEGYATARVGSGTYVSDAMAPIASSVPAAGRRRPGDGDVRLSAHARRIIRQSDLPRLALRERRSAPPFDFRYGIPDPDPPYTTTWRRILARKNRDRTFEYGPSEGSAALRSAVASYLARARGVVCQPEQLVIVNGAQQGLDLIARVLVDPGDRVALEALHYRGARDVFRGAGAKLVLVALDREGLVTRRLPDDRPSIRLLLATPSHQFPTGAVLPLERRIDLLRWAERSGAIVVEDDYDAEFRYGISPVEPLKALDGGQRVIYLNTFSKILFPSLRLAYVVVPMDLVPVFRAVKWLVDRHTPSLEQEVLAEFIEAGHFARHVRRARLRYDARRRQLLAALRQHFGDRVEIQGGRAGLHVLVWLRGFPRRRLAEVRERANEAGIGIDSAQSCSARPLRRAGILLGYQAVRQERIDEGIDRLAEVIRSFDSRR